MFNQSTAETQQDAANVYVTNYPAVPWSEIADKLEPKHNLTTEAARSLAAVTTQAQVSQFLSTFGFGLGLGLPTRTYLQSTADTNGVDSTSTTRTRGTGAIPSASGAAATTIGDAALAADLTKGPLALGLDANTLLTAGTAVFQLAAILDNQISKAVYPSGYNAHLLTFQVNLQPKKRSSAHDVYIDLAIAPASWNEAVASSNEVHKEYSGMPPVIVYPLIISDALETTSTGRSVELIRQAALSLSGVIGRLGMNAGVSRGTDELDSVIGQVRNSIITVGRVTDHALRVRIGALNSGESRYAMVPRSFNVSVVVLTRWPEGETGDDQGRQIKNLSVFADAEIANAESGLSLPLSSLRKREVLAEKVAAAIDRYGFKPRESKECGGAPLTGNQEEDSEKKKEREAAADRNRQLDLLRAADRQDYAYIDKCVMFKDGQTEEALSRKLSIGDRIRLERMLSELYQIQGNSGNSKMLVALKPKDAPKLPPDQLVSLIDDSTSITATLRGGASLRADQIKGQLDATGVKTIIPKSVTVRERSEVVVTFPHLSDFDLSDTTFPNPTLTLKLSPGPGATNTKKSEYRGLKIVSKKDGAAKSANPLSVTQAVIIPNKNGEAQVGIQIGEVTGYSGPLRLRVGGADLRDDPSGLKVAREGGVDVSQKSVARLNLGNLTSLRDVTVTAFTKDPKTNKEAKAGDPITLKVAR